MNNIRKFDIVIEEILYLFYSTNLSSNRNLAIQKFSHGFSPRIIPGNPAISQMNKTKTNECIWDKDSDSFIRLFPICGKEGMSEERRKT